jgi:thiol-disulfide isomerase/thioredoxin
VAELDTDHGDDGSPEPDAPLPDDRPQRRREYSGPLSTLGLAALVVAVVGFAIWWFEVRGGDSGGIETEGLGVVELADALNPTGRPPSAEPGRAAPNFRLADLAGGALTLSDLQGTYVLLNFWASWCGPCRGETPDLQRLYERLQPSGRLVVVGVNQQEDADTARSFVHEFGVTYPIVLDQTGEVSSTYRVGRGLPVSILLDPVGVIVDVYIGRVGEEELAAIERDYLVAAP